MMNLKRCQFLVGLIIVLVCVSALCQQPQQSETELRFEISSEEQQWIIEPPAPGKGPIRPTHVAVLFIRQPQYMPIFTKPPVIEEILGTTAGKLMSQKQRDFISAAKAFCQLSSPRYAVPNHYHFRLYAVSEADARNMAQAFIEYLTITSNAIREQLLTKKQGLQRQINTHKNKISETEAELKNVQTKLNELKGRIHYLTIDEAEQTVLELNKMLDALDVEIAGLQAKVSTIEKYRSDKKITNEDTLAKLEQMLSEQAVELAGALARKEASTRIRNQAEEFYNLRKQQISLPDTLIIWRKGLSSRERDLEQIQDRLIDSASNALPLKVYQNKVTIYPVRVEG
ncbi:MAG: hypothetical protein ACETVZ_07575 [Phycisphaerae bacterium]